MTVDEYRRHAIEAEGEAGHAIESRRKASLLIIAKHWRALAEQLEWLESRLVAEFRQDDAPHVMQQQQQIQLKKEQ
jgi:hypothetical protein